jgi:hypothetical protein
VRKHPAHGFLGEPEIVGNVDPAHGQVEGPLGDAAGPLGAFDQRKEEARQPFGSSLAAKQHHLPLGLGELVRGETVKLTLDARIFADEPIEGLARKPPQFRLFECFHGKGIFLVHADAEKIAWKHKAGDLAPAVGEQRVELKRTTSNHEHALRRVTLVKY